MSSPARPLQPMILTHSDDLQVTSTSAAGNGSPVADLDLIIPALNEEHRIGPTLRAISGLLNETTWRTRILVVDNGSVDATVDTVDQTIAQAPNGQQVPPLVISCAARGKGAAVRAGVQAATAPFVGYVDADQSTPPEALITAMAILTSGWDAVIGSRRAVGANYVVAQSRFRRAGSLAFNLAASSVVGKMSDTQCGFKLFRTTAVRDVFSDVRLEGFAFDVEVLARLRAKNNLKLMEMPVQWSDDSASTFRPFRDGTNAFRDLITLRRDLRGHTLRGKALSTDTPGRYA